MALRRIKADLHVHTCLSPCSGLDMSPREVVSAALHRGLDMIGVCDHNSAENVLAVRRAGERNGLTVLGGMEITTSEEAHLLAFFDDMDDLQRFQELVYRNLSGRNDEGAFGLQVIADDEDGVSGFCDRLLIGATSLTAEQVIESVHAGNGESIVIAAHVDRESFSLIGQLGFIPPALALDAVEVSARSTKAELLERFPECSRYPVVTASDAHHPDDIGRRVTSFLVEDGTVAEIKKALLGKDGRRSEC